MKKISIARKARPCDRAVFFTINNTGGRPRSLSAGDARLTERMLSKKGLTIPKAAVMALNDSVNEWIARRALRKFVLISAVKQKKSVLSKKTTCCEITKIYCAMCYEENAVPVSQPVNHN
uniref:Uncharacterized protein n=1 Tax=Glossina austeni TaxID=7395 RepID=A0A1A9UJN4_GLOAU